MSKNKKALFIIAIFIVTVASITLYLEMNKEDIQANKQETGVTEEQLYTNLEAFGKLYGYIRYFHPSDEAASLSAMEWNQFVVYGVSKVKNARNEEELKETLEEVFLPVAPTMELYMEGQTPEQQGQEMRDGEVVAWQHYGLGTTEGNGEIYNSQRTTAMVKDGEYVLEETHLFDEFPNLNEIFTEKISPNIYSFIPLVLNKDDSGTIGSDQSSKAFVQLKNQLTGQDIIAQNEDVHFAGIIITWNVINHFYPYFHVVDTDWENQLVPALEDVRDVQNRDDYMLSVMRLLEKTKDGHAFHTMDTFNRTKPKLPFIVEKVEGQLVVAAASEKSGLLPGDVITSINSDDPMEVLEGYSEIIPGSLQFKEMIANEMIRHENHVELKIQREEKAFDLIVEPSLNDAAQIDLFNRNEDEAFRELEEDVYYIDFYRFNELEDKMETLLDAKGVIIDLRDTRWDGQKASIYLEELVAHLTDKPAQFPIGRVMKTIYPDQKNVTFEELPRYAIQPKEPKFRGEVVFLAFPGNLSNPEFWLGQIKDNQLATIIGQPTAGADGDIQRFSIPGSITVVFTGMEILNGDRTKTHTVGIQPDILVERTIEGIRTGEDEYITRALEYIIEGE